MELENDCQAVVDGILEPMPVLSAEYDQAEVNEMGAAIERNFSELYFEIKRLNALLAGHSRGSVQ